jgi:putative sterol carrier protein
MADPIAAFFEELASVGHEPLLHHATGTMRLDLLDGDESEHWHVAIRDGDVKVSRRNVRADAVMRTERKLFTGMVKGTVNISTALLRGVVDVEGDLGLLTSFSRLLPGPPKSLASFLEREKVKAG